MREKQQLEHSSTNRLLRPPCWAAPKGNAWQDPTLIRTPLKALLPRPNSGHFVQVHRSVIVAYSNDRACSGKRLEEGAVLAFTLARRTEKDQP
jgi:hypothetical protein